MKIQYEKLPRSIKNELKEECINSGLKMTTKELYDNITNSNGDYKTIACAFNVSNVIVFKLQELNK
ncbi:MAG: hypothetical protein U9N59_01240 [Campylobacterota bacterium]|nr:hypothetical protein [Campylobacterota bacterium]